MTTNTMPPVEGNPIDIDLPKRAFAKNRIANALIVAEDGQTALNHRFGSGRDLPAVTQLGLYRLALNETTPEA